MRDFSKEKLSEYFNPTVHLILVCRVYAEKMIMAFNTHIVRCTSKIIIAEPCMTIPHDYLCASEVFF